MKNKNQIKSATTHGMTYTRIYKTYRSMKSRCLFKGDSAYKNYGARGIRVCDEWLKDFMNFYNWAMENGYDDTLTIERINVNGNYEPSNCTFIPLEEQWKNKRMQSNNVSGCTGVTYKKQIKRWVAQIKVNGINIYLGCEKDYNDAVKLRKDAEIKYWGRI